MSAPLSSLAAQIRTFHQAVQDAALTALAHAMDCGDVLAEAKACAPVKGWNKWLRSECFMGASTARLYMQLAKHRAEIEHRIAEFPTLSLRAARKLISKPSSRPKTAEAKPAPTVSTMMNSLTDEQLTEALTALGFDRFRKVMPRDWVPQLERRLADQILSRLKQAQIPPHQLRKAKLRLVGGTDQHASH
jgi:Protein of unknown function (DUF3102)